MEPQQIHAHVVVFALVATHCDAAYDADDCSVTAVTPTLQCIAVNAGANVVAFRADFSASSSIRLRVPRVRYTIPASVPATTSRDTAFRDGLQLDCLVFPYERRTIAHVLREPGKRAFVRVHYELLEQARTLDISEIEQAQHSAALALDEATTSARTTYYANRTLSSVTATQRCCIDINRFFRAHRDDDDAVQFVDLSFPPSAHSLHRNSSNDSDVDDTDINMDPASTALYALSTWRHVHDIIDSDAGVWTFADTAPASSELRIVHLQSPLPYQDALVCALAFVSLDKATWLARLVPAWTPSRSMEAIVDSTAIGVRLCARGMRWRDVIVDLFVPSFPIGSGLLGIATDTGELYTMVLQKALAKLHGSYAAIRTVPTLTMLRELTGLPWVSAYRSSPANDGVNDKRSATQTALQRLLTRRCRKSRSATKKQRSAAARRSQRHHSVVVSFRHVDTHHCAFPVVSASDDGGVTLLDLSSAIRTAVDRRTSHQSVRQHVDKDKDKDDDGNDQNLPYTCTWDEFFCLQPHVTMLLASHRYAICKRRFALLRDRHPTDDPTAEFEPPQPHQHVQFALSVAQMTSVVIETQVLLLSSKRTRAAMGQDDVVSCPHKVTIDAVRQDFTLARLHVDSRRINTGDSNAVRDGSTGVETLYDQQLVVALGAGEYVLSIACSNAPASSSASPLWLTPADTTETLQLLFDCIDSDMNGAITCLELAAFLALHGGNGLTMSPASLTHFLQRFGRLDDSKSNGNLLLHIDDLWDVYQWLASLETTDVGPQEPALDMQQQQQRFAALIWSDLCHALQINCRSDVDKIDQQLGQEQRVCIHSDVPLVDVVALPMSNNILTTLLQ